MAYMNAERVKEIREQIKKEFPAKDGYKFSIRVRNHSTVCVDVMTAPFDILEGYDSCHGEGYAQVNHYNIERHFANNPKAVEVLSRIYKIMNEGNYDNSDTMTDYFDVGFYCSISIGKWDKPFKIGLTAAQKKEAKKEQVKNDVDYAMAIESVKDVEESEILEEAEIDEIEAELIANDVPAEEEKNFAEMSVSELAEAVPSTVISTEKLELVKMIDKYFNLAEEAAATGNREMFEFRSAMARECLDVLKNM